MIIRQAQWTPDQGWAGGPASADLVFAFGGTGPIADAQVWADLRKQHPTATIVGCSTAGEILDTGLHEDTVAATAVQWEGSTHRLAHADLSRGDDSREAGRRLAAQLPRKGLLHAFVLSDGHIVNGSELVAGLTQTLPRGVAVTGGLAGDGERFQRTLVMANEPAAEGRVALLGFYGSRFRVGFGSLGGWDPFGPRRRVTRAAKNILYEVDGQPALALYKKYLGEYAAGLPSTGLLFPLSLDTPGHAHEVVRTILDVDEAAQSLTFAGDVPEGSHVRLMKANFNRLVDGASGAAEASTVALGSNAAQLALLISCVGRRLVLKQQTEQELEAVREILGPGPAMTGFYSYGEICPAAPEADCELHNQTMTVTTLGEN